MAEEYEYVLKTQHDVLNSVDFCSDWDIIWAPKLVQFAVNTALVQIETKVSEMESGVIAVGFHSIDINHNFSH